MTLRPPRLDPAPLNLYASGARVLRPGRAGEAVRPTRAEVNLAHLRHNLHVVKRVAAPSVVWAVLKADGYGHGAKAVARTLERAGAQGVCVSLLEEGIELREAGIKLPILVMGGYYGRAWGELLHHSLTPVIHTSDQVRAFAEEVRFASSPPVAIHLKIDTGMARLGITLQELTGLAELLETTREVRLAGLMTHFACADSPDTSFLGQQLERFNHAHRVLAARGLVAPLRHAANSAALLRSVEARLDMVRPGIALFGVEPCPGLCKELKPVMRVRTEIVAIRGLDAGQSVGYGATWSTHRSSRIATVPLGYADGISRGLSNRGQVLVRGRRAPIVGTISMDMMMIDVTDIEGACLGDECVVLGTQKGPLGEATITAQEIATTLGTIPWEILTNVSRRVPRFYREP